jgi:hypothetical protein
MPTANPVLIQVFCHVLTDKCGHSCHAGNTYTYMPVLLQENLPIGLVTYTRWSVGNACSSHKNYFVDFQDKTFLIAQRRHFNQFLTYITNGK